MKKTMKRIAAACLALMLCFSLVACGSSDNTQTTATAGSDSAAPAPATDTSWPEKDITSLFPLTPAATRISTPVCWPSTPPRSWVST